MTAASLAKDNTYTASYSAYAEPVKAESTQPPAQAAAPQTESYANDVANAVVKRPLVDITRLSKQYLLGLSTLLLVVLFIDGVYIWHKKVVRLSGRNSAHIVFIIMLIGLIWMMSFGSIL